MKRINLVLILVIYCVYAIAQISHFEALGYDYVPISGLGNWVVVHNDFDNDGDIDLFIGRSFQEDILLENDGRGHFTIKEDVGNWQTLGGSFSALFVDLNSDGFEDLVIARGPSSWGVPLLPGQNQLLLNNGDGTFTDATSNLPNNSIDNLSYSMGVKKGDFNNDGTLDLIFVNGGIEYLKDIAYFKSFQLRIKHQILQNDLYFGQEDTDNDGIQNFTNNSKASGIGLYSDVSTDVVVADFDGDGLDDIFITNFHDKTINDFPIFGLHLNDTSYFCKLFLNNPSHPGKFKWNFGFPLEKYPATSVDAGDFDKDGDVDLIIGMEKRADTLFNMQYSSGMTSKIFLNDGSGNFSDATESLFPTFKKEYTSCYDIRFVDFNNDGWLDIYGAGITCFLFIQTDTINHTYTDATHLLPISQAHPKANITHTYHSYGATFADFDKNGKTDVFMACTYEQLHLLFQNNNGHFIDTTTTNLPPDAQNTEYAVIADFTGDGLLDIIKVNNDISVNTHSFYIQTKSTVNNHPYFTDKSYQIPLPDTYTKNYGIDYHDIDGDNDLDILIAGEYGVIIFENDGKGNFTENTFWLSGINNLKNASRVRFVDIDGDNDKDIFVPRTKENKILLWTGTRYIDATSYLLPPNSNQSLDVDFADINYDNWMDFVVANTNGSSLYLSNSGKEYSISKPFMLSNSTSIKFAQLDGDNLMDVIEVNSKNTEDAVVYKNNGIFPFFNNATSIRGSAEESYDIEFSDFNEDGLIDVVVAGFAKTNRIFINKGNLNFQNMTSTFFPNASLRIASFTKSIQHADINQDGLIDIYLTRDNQDLILYGQGPANGIPELENWGNTNEIKIFPNPSLDYINFQLLDKENSISMIEIYSNDGKRVQQQSDLKDHKICIKDVNKGLYYLVITLPNIKLVRKFVKL